MALLKACADRVPRRPYGHVPTRQSRLRPTIKQSKITEPPQTCTATPTTANRPAPSPAAPANRKPVTHRTAATVRREAGLGAQTKPAHTALDATAAGARELDSDEPPRR